MVAIMATNYVVTAKKPTVVSHALVGNLTGWPYTDETWCARRANPACKVHAAQGGRKLGEKLVKFRSLDRKC